MNGPRLEVDLGALVRNWQRLDARSHYYTTTSAVLKSDAYGLGMIPAAKALRKAGCQRFYVAWASEGVALRKALGAGPSIAVFHGAGPGEWGHMIVNRLEPVLNTPEQIQEWVGLGDGRPVASLHIDTGMNRLGLRADDWRDASLAMGMALPTHVISHLACADEPDHPMNARQLETFTRACTLWPSSRRSLSATAGIYLGPNYHMDETRPGIGLYGGGPRPLSGETPEVVAQLLAPILQIRTVEAGASAGYGATWTTPTPRTLATVGAGYADGFLRAASNRGYAVVGGETRPIVGRVSMDLIIIDVTGVAARVDDEVELFGPSLSLAKQADRMDTLDYEALARLGARIQRNYTGGA